MESVTITLPETATFFETKADWVDFVKVISHFQYPPEDVGNYPDEFPCIAWLIHTEREMDRKDQQYYAFVYPTLD